MAMITRRILLNLAMFLCYVISSTKVEAHPEMQTMQVRIFPSLDTIILSCSVTNNDRRQPVLFYQGTKIESVENTETTFEKTYLFENFKTGEYKCKIDTAEATFSLKTMPSLSAMNDKDIVEMAVTINAAERSTLVEFESANDQVDFLCKNGDFPMKLNSSNIMSGIVTKGFIEYIVEPTSLSCSAYESSPLLDFDINYEDVFPTIQDFTVRVVKTPAGLRVRSTCTPIDTLKKASPVERSVKLYQGDKMKESKDGIAGYGTQLEGNMLLKCTQINTNYGMDVVAFKLDVNYAAISSKLDRGETDLFSFNVKMLERSIYVHNLKSRSSAASMTCNHNYKSMQPSPNMIKESATHQMLYAPLWFDNMITCSNFFGETAQLSFIKKGLRPIITKLSLEIYGKTSSKVRCAAHHRLLDYKITLYNLEWRDPRVKETTNSDLTFEANYASDKWKCVVETQTGKDEVEMFADRNHFNEAPKSRFVYDHDYEARIEPDSINPGWDPQLYVNSASDITWEGYFCVPNPYYNPNYDDSLVAMNFQDPSRRRKYHSRVACYSREVSGYSFSFVRDTVKLT